MHSRDGIHRNGGADVRTRACDDKNLGGVSASDCVVYAGRHTVAPEETTLAAIGIRVKEERVSGRKNHIVTASR